TMASHGAAFTMGAVGSLVPSKTQALASIGKTGKTLTGPIKISRVEKEQRVGIVNERYKPGYVTASSNLSEHKKMLRGSEGNAGLVPKEIGEKLSNKTFNNFDDFRSDFWKTVGESNYSNEFSTPNLARMSKGNAPVVLSNQSIGSRKTYELHHTTPVQHGGPVYDLSNIVITTPKFHMEILDKKHHFGGGANAKPK
ncbi:MAG: HNH endonuclease signature motif containing protein, partial [Alphaproteobacteria bacterium]